MTSYESHPAANDFPMMTGDAYRGLVASIRRGFDARHPILIYEGQILDGRNRYAACLETGTVPIFEQWTGDNPYDFVWQENGDRRDLDAAQKTAVRMINKMHSGEWEADQDQRRRAANEARSEAATEQHEISRPWAGERLDGRLSNDKTPSTDWGHIDLAREAGVSPATAARVQSLGNARPDLLEQVASGALKMSEAQAQRRRDEATELRAAPLPPPTGKYSTLVVDPPWPMQKIEREVAPNQYAFDYPVMTLDEIKQLDIVDKYAEDDCHLFLWTTQKFLPDALDVLDTWGFKYVLTMVWHKPGGFQPYNLPQYNCEFILYARRGSPRFLETTDFFTCFSAPRNGHSVKPSEFYATIARVCPAPRIEIFARDARPGFDAWGNES